ncbi:MAG TPA: hypothetical protein VKW04_02720 [Planctomycetota bacterium]|nr:hypothetical protein [Planctomycetota bacterium]
MAATSPNPGYSSPTPDSPALDPAGGATPLPRPLATTILASFVITFLLARLMVLLIMTHRIPSLYLHVGGTHVHHLNYGIFLLSAVGGALLLRPPKGRALLGAAAVYGIGLALTFDEFGMWIHLGGPYWQRASFDAVVVITGLLGLFAVAPAMKRLTWKGWVTVALLVVSLAAFGVAFGDSLRFAEQRWAPIFQQIEAGSPP